MKLTRFFAAVLAAAFVMATMAAAGDPTGTWKWSANGPGGRTMDITLKLELTDGQLSGTVTGGRMGDAPISNASFTNDEIAFSVTRARNGNTMTTNYRGKLEGDTIVGTVEMPAWRGRPGGPGGPGAGGPPPGAEGPPGGPGGGGESRKLEWHATRVK